MEDKDKRRGEPVGADGTMPGTSGFTMACFPADKVPVGTSLYTAPQPAEPSRGEQRIEWLREVRECAEHVATSDYFGMDAAISKLMSVVERGPQPIEVSRGEPGVTTTQALITLGKVVAGYRPGEEGWSEYDQKTYNAAMTATQPAEPVNTWSWKEWQHDIANQGLDRLGVPRSEGEDLLSLWGRVVAAFAAHGLRINQPLTGPYTIEPAEPVKVPSDEDIIQLFVDIAQKDEIGRPTMDISMAEAIEVARALLARYGAQPASIIEQIAQQWDGCVYEAAGAGDLDIGEAIRTAAHRLRAQPAASAEPTFICPKCGADRCEEGCKGNLMDCWIKGEAQSAPAAAQPSVPADYIKRVIDLCSFRGSSPFAIEDFDPEDKWIADLWRRSKAMLEVRSTPPQVRCNHCGWTGEDADLARDVAADEPDDGAADVCPTCRRIGDLMDLPRP